MFIIPFNIFDTKPVTYTYTIIYICTNYSVGLRNDLDYCQQSVYHSYRFNQLLRPNTNIEL